MQKFFILDSKGRVIGGARSDDAERAVRIFAMCHGLPADQLRARPVDAQPEPAAPSSRVPSWVG